MRIRMIVMIAVPVLLVGAGTWFFIQGRDSGPVGAGGLPLVKADPNPVKLPPDDPGGEVMPNADSTVFPAMGGAEADPSMENIRTPAPQTSAETSTDFAGLKTGFAVPVEQPKKVESLFAAPETAPVPTPTPASEPQKSDSKYVSGIAPEALEETTPTPETPKEEQPALSVPTPIANEAVPDEPSAAAMEAQEKAAMPSNIPVPSIKPTSDAKPQPQPKAAPAKSVQETVAEDVAGEARAPVKTPLTVTSLPAQTAKGYYIQLASTPSEAEARKLWTRLQNKYGGALSGLTPSYQSAAVPGKGPYIRIQAGPLTQDQATARCKQIHATDPKGGCLVLRR